MTEVEVILPNDVDDPAAPSGGNGYDRRVCDGLVEAGWTVREHAVHGSWPHPGVAERRELAAVLAGLPDRATVLVDGLIASVVPDVLRPQARRLRLVVLVHLPLGGAEERAALSAAVAIIATSEWSRRRLLDLHRLPPERVHVAAPGVDPAPVAPGTDGRSRLLCVAAVTPQKGYDVLAEALAMVADEPWHCDGVGALDRDACFVARLRGELAARGLADRLLLAGPRTGADLAAAYAAADLLVLPTRGETYGMVVTEALARGIPVLATEAGGLPEALGRGPDGTPPGLLVPPGDPAALAGALRRWLGDADLRERLRRSARGRRGSLSGWPVTAETIAKVLIGVPA
jgi:glycosyltransferase involved in cell wall biosynthesis